MGNIVLTVLIGSGAAFFMAIVCILLTKISSVNFDPLRALGSLISDKSPIIAGFSVHLVMGGVFALLYVFMWWLIGIPVNQWSWGVGAAMGLIHGFIVSFWFIIFVAEHHPLKKYRSQGFLIALSDIAGHVFFGVIIGFAVYRFGLLQG